MACVICGEKGQMQGSLVRVDDSSESPGMICRDCFQHLKQRRPDTMGCGGYPQGDHCPKEAAYATKKTVEMRDTGPEVAQVENLADEYLICEQHFGQIRDGQQPPWL